MRGGLDGIDLFGPQNHNGPRNELVTLDFRLRGRLLLGESMIPDGRTRISFFPSGELFTQEDQHRVSTSAELSV